MKLIGLLLVVLSLVHGVLAAESSIEFRGVMVDGAAAKLSLVDKSTDTTRWVEIGQTFEGFTVKAYDVAKETATLTKDGKEFNLRLNSSRITEADPAQSASGGGAALSEEGRHAILNNLRQISAAADQYYLESGKTNATFAELVGPDKYIKQINSIDGENYNSLRLTQVVESPPNLLSVVTKSGAKVEYDVSGTSLIQKNRPPAPEIHSVTSGDTAAKIAARYHLKVTELQALNPTVEWNRLQVGQTVKVK